MDTFGNFKWGSLFGLYSTSGKYDAVKKTDLVILNSKKKSTFCSCCHGCYTGSGNKDICHPMKWWLHMALKYLQRILVLKQLLKILRSLPMKHFCLRFFF
ncbi:hypothetical protein KP509_03G004800 [Ceratopteris richardii]|uniref:Uncharacterized protein n=1 Tax=Ceratopteris richardii TaxID=49495 RepID=A0A8T2V8L9_CERRI|nr:hypothetical protein KP509_03G004800 [Ceratopteris richardii]